MSYQKVSNHRQCRAAGSLLGQLYAQTMVQSKACDQFGQLIGLETQYKIGLKRQVNGLSVSNSHTEVDHDIAVWSNKGILAMANEYRVGLGYDIHRLVEGRKLIVGGITIEHDKGLLGHSDADVALHAVTDALLGAAGLPDIGDLFPDTDPAYENADSGKLLTSALAMIAERGLRPNNVDIIIHAEAPKLSPYKKQMAANIARLLEQPEDYVNVKAKTNEGLGPLGHSDAIACSAVATLVSADA